MSYDLLIKNGTVVDGTGATPKRADIAISAGRIAEIGKVSEGAARVIDASDLIVAPGFIDPHTHYDAQICWDPYITSSSWHGVTTVIMGNCGVGLAPCRPNVREIAAWDLVNVEGIPFDVLAKGVTWDWETFPQYLDAAQRRGSAINLGFMAALTPFRHYVMGEESMDRAATPDETAKIAAAIKQAVAEGAFGFSTSAVPQHIGYKGRPLACRNASRDEFKAYANALKELGKGAIELVLTKSVGVLADDEYEFLDLLLTESGRNVTWLALLNRDDYPNACQDTLRKAEPLIRRGGIPQVNCRPLIIQIDLRNPLSSPTSRRGIRYLTDRPNSRQRFTATRTSAPSSAERWEIPPFSAANGNGSRSKKSATLS
jgi:N-acyl-D-aspartate/D-glutamate deacylase